MPESKPEALTGSQPVPGYPGLRSSPQGRSLLTSWMLALALRDVDGTIAPGWTASAAPFEIPEIEGADASDLPALAEGHGLACLLAPHLPQAPAEPLFRALHAAAARCRARDALLQQEHTVLAAAMVARAVPHLWLKGAWLSALCYRPPACRPRADLDLLVPERAWPAADSVLRAQGYRPTSRTWKHQVWLRPGNHRVVDMRGEHPENPRPVELHGRLVEAFRGIELALDFEAALECRTGGFAGPDRALGMVHLCAHLTVDMLSRRARLIHLVDLVRLAPRLDDADWARVRGLAGGRQTARFVWPALALAVREAGAAVPASVLGELAQAVRPELRDWLDGVDPDALSRFGRSDRRRALLEVPRIWPIDAYERLRVWQAILWPGRWDLADRYPRLSASRLWRLGYVRHLGYTVRCLARRWRLRPDRSA